jgi:serine/threonine protein kinase
MEGMNRVVGSMLYMAPEILINESPYDEKCDLWSIGIVLYIMLTGCIPYTEREREVLKTFIIAGKYDK